MKRITMSMAALGVLAMFSAPATASDFSVFLRNVFNAPKYGAPNYNYRYVAPLNNPVVMPRNYHGYTNRIAPTASPVVQYTRPVTPCMNSNVQYRGELQRQQYLQEFDRRQVNRERVHQSLHSRPVDTHTHDRVVSQLRYEAERDQRQLQRLEQAHNAAYHSYVPNRCGTPVPRQAYSPRPNVRGLNVPSARVPATVPPQLDQRPQFAPELDRRHSHGVQPNASLNQSRLNQSHWNSPADRIPSLQNGNVPNRREVVSPRVPTYSASRIPTTFGY